MPPRSGGHRRPGADAAGLENHPHTGARVRVGSARTPHQTSAGLFRHLRPESASRPGRPARVDMPRWHARRHVTWSDAHRLQLEVLDLVPAIYRAARLARGRGAFQAMLVDRGVLVRTRHPAASAPRLAERSELTDFTDAELVAVTQLPGQRPSGVSPREAVCTDQALNKPDPPSSQALPYSQHPNRRSPA